MSEGWIAAICVGLFAMGTTAAFIAESTKYDNYRRRVEICATTADTPPEFRACVEVAR